MRRVKFWSILLILVLSIPTVAQTTRPVPQVQRVVIISIDGLRPDVLLRAQTPNIRKLMDQGTFTLWARTTEVSITLPSHVSMLTGVTPEKHAVDWNGDLPPDKQRYPKVATIFQLAHQAGLKTAMASGKSKFIALDQDNIIDWCSIPAKGKGNDIEVAKAAVRIIAEHKPDLLMVHFPGPDSAGHTFGWGSHEQVEAVGQSDLGVGMIVDELQQAQLSDRTVIILSADHGGQGKNHGPNDPRSRTIPWIAMGPGIQKNYDLTQLPKLTVNTEDTFATACWLLAIPYDIKSSDGKPLVEILEKR